MSNGLLYRFISFMSEIHLERDIIMMLAILWVVLIISKILWKRPFTNGIWETLFLITTGFATVVHLFYGSLYYVCRLELGTQISDAYIYDSFFPAIDAFFFFPLLAFFTVYLLYFVVRLGRFLYKRRASEKLNL